MLHDDDDAAPHQLHSGDHMPGAVSENGLTTCSVCFVTVSTSCMLVPGGSASSVPGRRSRLRFGFGFRAAERQHEQCDRRSRFR